MSKIIKASSLNANSIGEDIEFFYRYAESDIHIVRVELRQINHNDSQTIIYCGLGAEREYVLSHDHPISLDVYPDYSELKDLLVAWKDLMGSEAF